MKIQVLDHGYVELIECWGVGKDGRDLSVDADYGGEAYPVDDSDFEVGIIEAARQSTQGSFRGWQGQCDCVACTCGVAYGTVLTHEANCAKRIFKEVHTSSCSSNKGDAKLLRFLYEHRHSTPFEFSGMIIEVQAPIMVFREWHRHRTQGYSEASARYAPLPDQYYRPSRENVLDRGYGVGNTANKQAGALNNNFNAEFMDKWLDWVDDFYRQAEGMYQEALAQGIPKELARITMPVGHYSKMRAVASLRNWLAFLTLRMDPAAQWEIRQYAEAVAKLIAEKFPRTWELFNEHFTAQS